MLNENVVKLLKNGMWDLATCADGEPNVVPVAFKDVPPDDKLVIGDVFLDTTLKNIAANNGKIAISAFAALVSMGGAPKASIFLGKGENEQAERVVGSCTWMLLLLSVLLTGIMLAFGRPILLLFGASADTILFASDYMNIYCLGTVFTQMTLGLNAFITAQGKTLVCMGNVAVGAATNIVLDAVLINGFHRGGKEAALAIIISQGVSACFVIRYLCSGKSVLRLRLRNILFDGKHLWPCILLGTSPALMQLTENLVAISFNTSLQIYRRGYGGSVHEHFEQRHAVCDAAFAGTGAGSAAAAQL